MSENENDNPLSGCCTPERPCPNHFDDVFDAYRHAHEDTYLEYGR